MGREEELVRLIPAELLVSDPDVVASYARDQSRTDDRGLPLAVLMPRTTAEVSLCLRVLGELGIAAVPRGAGSGLSGAANASAGEVVISLHRMDQILEIDAVDRFAVVQPGVVTGDLRTAVRRVGLFYPPDPGSVESCTIGGNAATNAGGMCCVKYGVTSDFVIGLEVVLADGRVLRTGRRTVKGVAGYDLTHLFVGSEGTLGIITEVTVRLVPEPSAAHTLVASFRSLRDAGAVVAGINQAARRPSLLEILDRTTVQAVDRLSRMGIGADVAALLLVQGDDAQAGELIDRVEQICIRHGATDLAKSSDPSESAALVEVRRLALPALEQLGDWLLDDVAVPCSGIVDLIEGIEAIGQRLGLVIGVFGHAGDGNLHPTLIFDEDDPSSLDAARTAFGEITQLALTLGGTITGEHGVGRLKREWLVRELDATALAVHTSIKAALDPRGLLNPGAVLAPPSDSPVSKRD